MTIFQHPSIVSPCQFSSVAQSCPNLRSHGLQHARLPCPSPTPRACSNSQNRQYTGQIYPPSTNCFQFPQTFSSVQFSRSVMSESLPPCGLQHARPPCPSSTPGVYSNSCPLTWWCHPTISSSVIPFSSHYQSFPAPGSFPMSQLFASGGQSIGVSASASVLPMNTQDWSPLGWIGWISLHIHNGVLLSH